MLLSTEVQPSLVLGLLCVTVALAWRISIARGARRAEKSSMEIGLLADESQVADEFKVADRSELASRQALYVAAGLWHAVAFAWAGTRGGSSAHIAWCDGALVLTWALAHRCDAAAQRRLSLEEEDRKQRPRLWLCLVACLAGAAVALEAQPKLDAASLARLAVFATDLAVALVALRPTPRSSRSSRPPTPEEAALELHEICLFTWLTPILNLGAKKALDLKDLPPVSCADSTVEQWRRFSSILGALEKPRTEEQKSEGPKCVKRRLWLQLVRLVSPQLSAFAVLAVIGLLLNYVRIVAFNRFLLILGTRDIDPATLWTSIGVLFLAPLLAALISSLTSSLQTRMSLRCRSALVMLIYRKSLRVDFGATGATTGEIVNLMSADVDSIVWTAAYSDQLWVPVLQATMCLGFIFYLVGISGLCAAGVMLAMAIANNRGFKFIWSTQEQVMKARDARLDAISETLQNIRLVKLCGMEPDVTASVGSIRDRELGLYLRFQLGVAALISFITAGPKMAALSTFLTYTLALGEALTPAKGFSMLELLSDLETSFVSLPNAVDSLTRAATALKKLDEFLDVREVDDVKQQQQPGVPSSAADAKLKFSYIDAELKGSFNWSSRVKADDVDKDEEVTKKKKFCGGCCCCRLQVDEDESKEEPPLSSITPPPSEETLKDVALRVERGSLVVVYGATGSGKSSLLAALLGEIECVRTEEEPATTPKRLFGTVALVPQKAWCQNASVRANICGFGCGYDRAWYRRTVAACALKKDFELLDARDHTKIGSRGINLSGGQQARVNLARCVYARPDIALLDDPLSAVDAHVGQHLFEHAILGELGRATRILVTHQVELTLGRADYVVVVEHGCIVEQGPAVEMRHSKKILEMLSTASTTASKAVVGNSEEALSSSPKQGRAFSEEPKHHLQSASPRRVVDALWSVQSEAMPDRCESSDALTSRASLEHDDESDSESVGPPPGSLNDEEHRDSGRVKWKAYVKYLGSVDSPALVSVVLVMLLATQLASYLQDYYMAKWIQVMQTGDSPVCSEMYAYALTGSLYVVCFSFGFTLRSWAQVRASKVLHDDVWRRVLGAKVGWFDKTPVGRIQNRFSSDIQQIDRSLPPSLYYFVFCLMNPIATVAAMTMVAPTLLLLLPPIIIFDCVVAKQYIGAARECKRLASLNRSPVYEFFTETLMGLTTIRAFAGERHSERRLAELADASIRCDRAQQFAFRWLSVRLEAFGACLGGATAVLLATVLSDVDPALAGFVMQYSAAMCFYFKYIVECYANLEMAMNSMERIVEYSELEQEPELSSGLERPPAEPEPSWPAQGEIVFENVGVRYASSPSPVLKQLSFTLKARTKTGVVGRTGAGKSTLTLALLRMVPTEAGRIVIDGLDIDAVRLTRLRQSVAIVPQEPALFKGTIRSNLDAAATLDDAALLTALRRVQLTSLLLDSEVSDTGSNLSVGERQLLCLARSLLRGRNILVMDEATANVDPESDKHIQHVIRNELDHVTVVCVAHRLKTIIFYDNVMVLERGELSEFGAPHELVEDPNSAFHGLCDATGDLSGLQHEASTAARAKADRRSSR